MESFFELDRMQFEAIPLPVEPLHIKMGEWPLELVWDLIGCQGSQVGGGVEFLAWRLGMQLDQLSYRRARILPLKFFLLLSSSQLSFFSAPRHAGSSHPVHVAVVIL
jgi:hypothetical protein